MNLREALEKKAGVVASGEHFVSVEIIAPIIEKAVREALLEMTGRASDYWGRGQDEGVIDDCVSVFVAEIVKAAGTGEPAHHPLADEPGGDNQADRAYFGEL